MAFLTNLAKNGAAIVTYNEWSRPAVTAKKTGESIPLEKHLNKYEHPGDMEHMAYFEPLPAGGGKLCAAWERYPNLKGIVNATTTEVSNCQVTYRGGDGDMHTLSADDVLICGGMKPRLDEALAYAQSVPDFYLVGDCNGAGNIQRCMRDALGKTSQF